MSDEFKKKYYKKVSFRKGFNFFEELMINLFKSNKLLSDYYHKFFKIFLSLPKNADILDLGIADGGFTHFMHRLRPDINYYGLDITDVSKLLPKYITFLQKDATRFELNKKFDLIVSNHLIEHLNVGDVPKVFDNANKHLKKRGIFWITTPSLCKTFYNDPTHVRPYTKEALQRLFYMSDFKQINVFEGDYFNFPFNMLKNKFKKNLRISYGFAGKK